MKLCFAVAVIALFSECSSTNQVIGTYSDNYNPYLKLLSDSTFIYSASFLHSHEFSEGKWKKTSRNCILLNSNIESRGIALMAKEIDSNNLSGFNLHIGMSADKKLEIYKCKIFINDTLYALNNEGSLVTTGIDIVESKKEFNPDNPYLRYISCDSISSLKINTGVHSIFLIIIKAIEPNTTKIPFDPTIATEKYFLKSPNTNCLQLSLSLKDSLFYYKVFNDEKMKVKKNCIKIFSPNIARWRVVPKAN